MQRHITSVFSEYDTMDNNSANSKQLQYWLKQIANPVSTPNLGFQWTFMTNQSSSFERSNNNTSNHISEPAIDQMSFGKTVHSSIDKQNNSLVSNNNNNKGQFSENKSKSYVNAMIALQKKVKTLEDENMFMKKNIMKINEERNRSMSDSIATEQQLKTKLKIMEPKVAKIEELIEQNKVLRVGRQEKVRKIKQLQKYQIQLTKKLETLTKDLQLIRQSSATQQTELQGSKKKIKQLQGELQAQYNKNKTLEQMKEKSTVSLLDKYNKSVELVQELEKENGRLKNQINYFKNKYNEDVRNIHEEHQREIRKCQAQFEKLKESVELKDSLMMEKKKQAEYFRQAYQKKDEEFIELVKSQQKLIEQQKSQLRKLEQEMEVKRGDQQLSEKKQKKKQQKDKQNGIEERKEKLKQKQNLKQKVANKNNENYLLVASQQSSAVKLPQVLIPNSRHRGSFQGFDSCEEEEELNESAIPIPIQTKSVGKPVKKKRSQRKQVLSSESRRVDSKTQKNSEQKNIRTTLVSPKQYKKKSKKTKLGDQQEASFTMKSCEPTKIQQMHRITFQDNLNASREDSEKNKKIANSFFYSAQQHPPLPHQSYRNMNNTCEECQQIQDFHYRNNTSHQSIDEVMLIELQKELLELYEQQENLILASNDEFVTQAERSEYVGQLKQINQRLRIKNQKICQLKAKA